MNIGIDYKIMYERCFARDQIKNETISQQAEIIKILSEACESMLSNVSSLSGKADVTIAREALAQIEKLKGEVR